MGTSCKWDKMVNSVTWEEFKKTDNEYQMFQKSLKNLEKVNNASTELFRQQQELLGSTPPLNDPIPEYYQGPREEEVLTTAVGDSPDQSSALTILQSTVARTDSVSTDGLPDNGGGAGSELGNTVNIPGSDSDSGTETSNGMEEKD